jgi:hypothetical protein
MEGTPPEGRWMQLQLRSRFCVGAGRLWPAVLCGATTATAKRWSLHSTLPPILLHIDCGQPPKALLSSTLSFTLYSFPRKLTP